MCRAIIRSTVVLAGSCCCGDRTSERVKQIRVDYLLLLICLLFTMFVCICSSKLITTLAILTSSGKQMPSVQHRMHQSEDATLSFQNTCPTPCLEMQTPAIRRLPTDYTSTRVFFEGCYPKKYCRRYDGRTAFTESAFIHWLCPDECFVGEGRCVQWLWPPGEAWNEGYTHWWQCLYDSELHSCQKNTTLNKECKSSLH